MHSEQTCRLSGNHLRMASFHNDYRLIRRGHDDLPVAHHGMAEHKRRIQNRAVIHAEFGGPDAARLRIVNLPDVADTGGQQFGAQVLILDRLEAGQIKFQEIGAGLLRAHPGGQVRFQLGEGPPEPIQP